MRNSFLLALCLTALIYCSQSGKDTVSKEQLPEQMQLFFEQSLRTTYGDKDVAALYKEFFEHLYAANTQLARENPATSADLPYPRLKINMKELNRINRTLFIDSVYFYFYCPPFKPDSSVVHTKKPAGNTFFYTGPKTYWAKNSEQLMNSAFRNELEYIMATGGMFNYEFVSNAAHHTDASFFNDRKVREFIAVACWQYLCETNGIIFVKEGCSNF
jgi:hypothetical protein